MKYPFRSGNHREQAEINHNYEDALGKIRGIMVDAPWRMPRSELEGVIRQAEMRMHPGRGGKPTEFHGVQKIREVLLG